MIKDGCMQQEEIERRYRSLTVLKEEYDNCTKCGLADTRTNVVFGIGALNNILIVAEAPGETEDRRGYPLVGQSGQILDYLLARTSSNEDLKSLAKTFPTKKLSNRDWGWKDFEQAKTLLLAEVFYTNTVLCRPPENRNPSNIEIKACNDRLLKTIYEVDPKIIIAAGKISLETLIGKKVASISKLAGRLVDISIPGRFVELHYTVMPIFHPAYLARNIDIGKKGGEWDLTLRHIETVRRILSDYSYATKRVEK